MDYKPKILHLTLSELPFRTMVKGGKDIEFRCPSHWIKSRLKGKEYDFVRFANGYKKDAPYFIAEYKGFTITKTAFVVEYVGGLRVPVSPGFYMIFIGKITEKGNLKSQSDYEND
jgi:hypothetical protein